MEAMCWGARECPSQADDRVAHAKGFQGPEGTLANVERVVCGYAQGFPVGFEDHVFGGLEAQNIANLGPDNAPFRGEGQQMVSRSDGAYGRFPAVGQQNQIVGQKTSLVVDGNAAWQERPARAYQKVISGFIRLNPAHRAHRFRLKLASTGYNNPVARPDHSGDAEFPRAHHHGMFRGDEEARLAGRKLQEGLDLQFGHSRNPRRLQSLLVHSPDHVALVETFNGNRSVGGQDESPLAQAPAAGAGPGEAGWEAHRQRDHEPDQAQRSQVSEKDRGGAKMRVMQ